MKPRRCARVISARAKSTMGLSTGLERRACASTGTHVIVGQLPNKQERWRARDEKGNNSDDGFNRQRHLDNKLVREQLVPV